jgi:aminoglycoside phosphotransferase (APT) family kinase protein
MEKTVERVTRSSRDPAWMRERLEAWLRGRLPAEAGAKLVSLQGTSANGMSSETLLVVAEWAERGARREHPLVVRVAPAGVDVPVFPRYELGEQFDVMRAVGELTSVPVPRVWWNEPDASVLGTPFFAMERLDGLVPPDVPPYTFGNNWLFDASPAERRTLQDETVAVLAGLHAIDEPEKRFAFLDRTGSRATPLRRRLQRTRDWYEWIAADFVRSPLIDAALAWLEQNFPEREGPAVLNWGDARIGNMMFRDFRPVAVLDWEMACVAPRELDVAWLAYSHRVFQEINVAFSLPGLPDFLRAADVCATYERLTGYRCADIEWHMTHAAAQYSIVFLRTGQRAIHFGEREQPAQVDELLFNRAGLERKLAGLDWSDQVTGR